VFLIFFIWVRATLPRIRYDRLMQFGWKVMIPLALLAVTWTSVSVVLGDAFGSPTVYGIVSAIFFVLVVAGGYAFLRDTGASTTTAEPDIADDPIVTGQYRGPGWIILNLVGGLISVPFLLVRGTIGLLEHVEKSTTTNTSTAIEPASKSVTKSSGD
jgi:hypothetical protein